MDHWRMKVADVRVTGGAGDYRIYQQDAAGRADIELSGTWDEVPGARDCQVYVRVLSEENFSPVEPTMTWTPVDHLNPGTWSHTLRGVPAGGLYQIQTRLGWRNADGSDSGRLATIVHHVGVGDLWVIGGQSNASGTGRGIADDGPELGVHILRNDERWGLAAHPLNDPTLSDHPNRDRGPGTSPYLKFAKLLRRTLGYPIGLIQTAMGGSSLRLWHVEEDPKAPLWHNFVYCVRLAGGRIKGLAWYQGCSDGALSTVKDAWTYEARFAAFLARARREFGPFPAIVTQINRWTDVAHPPEILRHWSILRETQRRAAKLPGVCVVPTLDLPLSDGIHTSSSGNVILGERSARAALGFVYGRPVIWKSPNLRTARRLDQGGAVELAFDDVASQLLFLGFGVRDFLIEDQAGPVEIAAAACNGATVKLTLARALQGPAEVHGGYGVDPETTLRDLETNLPMLGFHGVKIE